MPHITARDGTRLYYEEAGQGTPVVFVHEYAADYRTWEPQMRRFSRSHRCITYSQRGYPPSDIPNDPDKYSQDCFSDDVTAVCFVYPRENPPRYCAPLPDDTNIGNTAFGCSTTESGGSTWPLILLGALLLLRRRRR